MLPYIAQPQITLFGGFSIHLFGLLVLTGILVGLSLSIRRAREHGISENEIAVPIFLALIFGFLGSHWVEILAYHPERLSTEGWLTLFKVWDGMSSYGGFAFGAAAVLFYHWQHPRPWPTFADIYVQGLLVGFTVGRLGCTFAHDHPGSLTAFPLSFAYPDGARHDLGFDEFLYLALIVVPASFWLHRCKAPAGVQLAMISVLYAPVRFFLDFLRAEDLPGADVRWWGLTPAQYSSIALFAFGLWLSRKVVRIEKLPKA
jgi:phosphatidylglycerol:prolipoprotein diacylglycerol transferase